jgi:hypothetical protein
MHQDFILGKWSAWPPIDENSLTQAELLSSIPKMLKRRLSPLARIVFCAAIPCIGDNANLLTVFSSTHGELAKSFKMMEMIEAGEEISPTAFSLSVHNAIAGLFSMVFKNKLQTTVVAPGEEGIAPAFIEALGLLDEGEKEVLIVLYDEPLVSFYPSAPYQLSTNDSCAIALTVSKKGAGIPMRFRASQVTGDDGEQPLQVPLLIDFLAKQKTELLLHTPRHSWCWEKQAD